MRDKLFTKSTNNVFVLKVRLHKFYIKLICAYIRNVLLYYFYLGYRRLLRFNELEERASSSESTD